jgi:hypothetical protein
VFEEATQVRHALHAIVDDVVCRPIEFVSIGQWEKHRDMLAHQLRKKDWDCVSNAYSELQRLLAWVRASDVDGELHPDDQSFVSGVTDALDHAIFNHLIQLSVHGPQCRSVAIRYHRTRTKLRPHHDAPGPTTAVTQEERRDRLASVSR